MSGNFYENLFVSTVGEAVLAKGLAFLAVNNRGHEYASDNVRRTPEGGVFSKGGATWEVFDESLFDVGGGARYLASRGHEGIYFEGHSLGCLKVAHYLAKRRDPLAVGAVLISPADMFGIRAQNATRPLDDLVREARALTAAGKGDTLMPDAGYEVPLSATMVASVYGDPRKTDIFPFRLGDAGDYSVLASLAVPLLVVYGTLYEAVTVPVADALALAKAHATASPRVTAVAVEGGDHIYLGREDELARVVASFVEA